MFCQSPKIRIASNVSSNWQHELLRAEQDLFLSDFSIKVQLAAYRENEESLREIRAQSMKARELISYDQSMARGDYATEWKRVRKESFQRRLPVSRRHIAGDVDGDFVAPCMPGFRLFCKRTQYRADMI